MKFSIKSLDNPVREVILGNETVDYYYFFSMEHLPCIRLNKLSSIDLVASLKNKKNILILADNYKSQEHSFSKRVICEKSFIEMNPSSIFFFKDELLEWESFESIKNWLISRL